MIVIKVDKETPSDLSTKHIKANLSFISFIIMKTAKTPKQIESNPMKMYGIPNCDTVRKARKYLENSQLDYEFHDFKKQGLSLETINEWLEKQPIELLVNKRSTSWKQLNDEQKQHLMDKTDLTTLTQMLTLIKRPVLETENALLIGFKADDYQALI